MVRKNFREVLDEGGFVDYRDVFRRIERDDTWHLYRQAEKEYDDELRDEELTYLRGWVAKNRKRKRQEHYRQ